MAPDRRARRDALLEEALALDAPSRAAFLDRSCDSPSLRREIDALLNHDDGDMASLLDQGAESLVGGALSPGDRVGRYVIEDRIGAGGMSEVYRARDPMIARAVALKVLASLGSDEQRRKRFFAELRLLGRVAHDNVVRVYDFGEHAGAPYLVTELLEGEDLAEAIAAGRGGDVTARLQISRQIASALKDIHAAGILHRDIKPANVFIETSGRAKLLDFGIARDDAAGATTATLAGGTPGYIAPEQLNGSSATVRSDVYAFGVLLFELFSGERLYRGTVAQVLYAVAHDQIPLDRLRNCPDQVVDVVRRATLKDPEQRIQSFDEVVRLLDGVALTGAGAAAVSAPVRPSGVWKAMMATLAVAATLAGGGVWWRQSPPPEPSPAVPLPVPHRVTLDLMPAELRGRDATSFAALPIVLRQDDRFRLRLSTTTNGHLYVFAKPATGDKLNVLFPTPLSYDGTSAVASGAAIRIPQTTWLEFDPHPGRERLWVAWSAQPLPELESARQWANDRDRGAIPDADARRRILALLDSAGRPWQSTAGALQLEGHDDLLAAAVDIEHR